MEINLRGRLEKFFSNSNILKNGVLSLIGTFLVKAVNLISIPVFSRMMSTDEYGKVSIFMTYVSIFTVLLGLDFLGAVEKGCLDFKNEKNQFMSAGAFFTGVFTLIILCIVNIFHSFFCSLLSMDWMQLNILLLYSYASFIVSYLSVEYIFYYRYKLNILLSTAVALCNFGVSVVLIKTIYSEHRFLGRVFGAAIPTIFIAAFLFLYLIVRGKTFYNRRYVVYFMKMGIPLIPHNLSHLLLGNADKVMIENMISSAANGIYSLVYNLGWMLSVLVEALNNVWIPWMFRKLEDGNVMALKGAFNLYMAGFAAVTVAVEALAPEFVKLIAPAGYWEGIHIVVWIIFSAYLSFMYTLYVNIEFYEKKTYLISIGTILAALINIILNACFLKAYGYRFAAISTVISYFTLAIFHMCIVVFLLKKSFISCKVFILFMGIVFGISLLMQILLEQLLLRVLLAACSIFVIGVYFFKCCSLRTRE